MAKRNKNKKAPNVTASEADVSNNANETLSIPLAEKGKVPEAGTPPEGYSIDAEAFARFQADAEAGKLRLPDDEPSAEQIEAFGGQEKWEELKRKVNDVPFEDRTITLSTPTSSAVSLEQAYGRVQPLQTESDLVETTADEAMVDMAKEHGLVLTPKEKSEDPITLLDGELEAQGTTLIDVLKGRSGGQQYQVGDSAETNYTEAAEVQEIPAAVELLERPKPVAVFATEELKKLIPDEFGLVPGTLLLVAYNAGQYRLQDITAWLDRSLDWGDAESPDFIFYNASSDRSMIRNQRTQAVIDNKVAIGILACQPHCFMMEPHHIPHTMEADVVLSIDALRVTRDKYRGITFDHGLERSVSFK